MIRIRQQRRSGGRRRAIAASVLVACLSLAMILGAMAQAEGASSARAGCAEKLNDARNLEGPTGESMIRVSGIRSAKLCRYYGDPEGRVPVGGHSRRGRFARSRLLPGAREARSLAHDFDQLRRYTEAEVEEGELCPVPETGAGIYVVFVYGDGQRSSATVRSSGCPYVTEGRSFYELSNSLWHRLERLIPVKEPPPPGPRPSPGA
jgi:hypothetical protein